MKLVYLWVEHFWCFQEQGFHFTKEYCFQMIRKSDAAPKYILSVEKQNKVIKAGEMFGGNILDFRIFVGENGSGKTALSKLVEAAFGRLGNGIMQRDLKLLAVFKQEEDGFYVCDWGFGREELLLEGKEMKKNSSLCDIPHLIFPNEKTREDIKLQIEFVYDYQRDFSKLNNWIRFPVPRELKIMPELEEAIFRKAVYGLQRLMAESISRDSLTSRYVSDAKARLDEIRINIDDWIQGNNQMFDNEMQSLFRTICTAIIYKLICDTRWTSKQETKLATDRVDEFWKKLQAARGSNIWELLRAVLKEVDQPENKMDSFLKLLAEDVIHNGSLKIHEEAEIEKAEKINRLIEFYNSYISAVSGGYPEFLRFDWGLSSGEYNMLNSFSHIHKFRKEEANLSGGTVFLFLDEIDLSLHPRWQQQYLKKMLDFLKTEFPDRSLQLCLTTHSPIILSDIPHQFITYFSKSNDERFTGVKEDERRRTYGANIYDIYRDSFYLSTKECRVIGDFVDERIRNIRGKMKEIKEKLNDRQNPDMLQYCRKELEDCRREIGYIDDPMLKGLLLSSYEEIFRRVDERFRIFAHIDQFTQDEINFAMQLLEQRKEKMEKEHGTADNAG